MNAPLVRVLLVLMASITMAASAKVLLVPVNVNSHVIMLGRLATGLADHGHATSMLIASNVRVPDWLKEKAEIITYSVEEPVPYANSPELNSLLVKIAAADSMWEQMPLLKETGEGFAHHWNRDCEQVLDDNALLQQLGNAGYDLAIMDMSWLYCIYYLPYKLGVPYAHFTVPFSPWLYRVPSLPSFMPNKALELSDRMTFTQRLRNVMLEAMTGLLINDSTGYSERYVPEKPSMTPTQFMKNGVLFFMQSDLAVNYPSPAMPNTVEIADIMAQPAKPLPAQLAKFMNESQDGVILASFGSFFDHMPEDIATKFCEAFKKIRHRIIWKIKKVPEACDLLPNVHVMDWIPQNDLLAHPDLKAFITHGGINSLVEAVYHEVPMVVIPIALDQPYNAGVVQNKGLGLKMRLSSFTAEELVDNIHTVTNSDSIAANLKVHSAVLRHKPQSAAERVAFWVDHVTKYGAEHLRTAAMELSAAQFFMVDIFVFILAVVVVLFFVIVGCIYTAFKCVKRCCCKNQQKLKLN